MGTDVEVLFGGKGANQAVAAARLGGQVRFVAALGMDDLGDRYERHLRAERIDTTAVMRTEGVSTGCAFIVVEEGTGENMIVVSPGANARLTRDHVVSHGAAIASSQFLLLQFEVPLAAITASLHIARENGVTTVLNPSPLPESYPLDELGCVDYLVLNRVEASAILGEDVTQPELVSERLLKRAGECVVITGGRNPTLVRSCEGAWWVPVLAVEPVIDTVGAGDTLAGALAVALSEGRDVVTAVAFAHCAAALAITRQGAQTSMPSRAKVEERLRHFPFDAVRCV
jgi:ribokinase